MIKWRTGVGAKPNHHRFMVKGIFHFGYTKTSADASVWTVQSNDSASWSAQTDDSSTWTNQAEDAATWEAQ